MLDFTVGNEIELHYKKPAITKKLVSKNTAGVQVFGSPEKNPAVTVQITAYNEKEGLITCLDKLQKQTYTDFEIVLVDNGLDNETVSKLEAYDLTYIKSTHNLGCTKGRNLGSAYANGELLVFIDADGFVEKEFLSEAVMVMKDNSIVAARGKVLPLESSESIPGHYNMGDKPGVCLISTEGNSIWRTKDYNAVGGFEDSLAGAEGLVICYRMVELYGYDVESFRYDPSFILYHDFHSDKRHLESKLYKQSVIRDAVARKYPTIKQLEARFSEYGLRPQAQKDARIAATAHRMRQKITSEYDAIYEDLRDQRKADPAQLTEMNQYDFTVVIPCYNLGSMLLEALDSVLKQSLKRLQVVIVDDASTDEETQVILSGLERQYHVIRQKKNAGVAAARNVGLKHAKAPFALCLDADDTIEPTYLEKAYNMFHIREKAGIISAWAKYFGGVTGEWRVKPNTSLTEALVGSPVHTASTFRMDAYEQTGGYEESMRGYEDWELWISILEKNWTVDVIPEIMFNYYVRPDGKVKTSNKNAKTLIASIVKKHYASYEKHMAEVIAEKHKQITSLRIENNELKKKALRTMILNSKLGRPLRIGARASRAAQAHTKEVIIDYKESGSARFAGRSLSRKAKNATSRVRARVLTRANK